VIKDIGVDMLLLTRIVKAIPGQAL